jgi:hypothetical protein
VRVVSRNLRHGQRLAEGLDHRNRISQFAVLGGDSFEVACSTQRILAESVSRYFRIGFSMLQAVTPIKSVQISNYLIEIDLAARLLVLSLLSLSEPGNRLKTWN